MQPNQPTKEPTIEQLKEALFTSYVLGECDESQRAEVESAIATDPSLRDELAAIRETHQQLKSATASLPPLQLRPEQRAKLEAEISDIGNSNVSLSSEFAHPADEVIRAEIDEHEPYRFSIWTKRSTWFGVGGAALAACLMFLVAWPLIVNPQPERSSDVALDSKADNAQLPTFKVDESRAQSPLDRASGRMENPEQGEAMMMEMPLGQQPAGNGSELSPRIVPPSEANKEIGDRRGAMRDSQDAPAAPSGGGGVGGGADGRGVTSGGGTTIPKRNRENLRWRQESSKGSSGERVHLRRDGEGQLESPRQDVPGATNTASEQLDEDLVRESVEIAAEEDNFEFEYSDLKLLREFTLVTENADSAISTFSIDVDTASYAHVRRMLQQNQLPSTNEVRIEEMLNYFPYDDPAPAPDSQHPMQITTEIATCPWNPEHRLARVAMKATEIDMANRVGSNLVFLVDVSGSMRGTDRLPLLQQSMSMLVDQLSADDRVAIVTYASGSQIALPSTPASRKDVIQASIDQLQAGGSTNGSAGIQTAYDLAVQNTIAGGNNRVIWATDGDLNVGITSDASLVELIEEKREAGTMLTVLGFGTGNLKDGKLEAVSNAGNGTYAYIDSEKEAKRVLIDQIGGTLFTVAKDVKIQVEFNPAKVAEYRLIGYDNRRLTHEEFRDDAVDAGELGAGHSVTALYEIIPVGAAEHVAFANDEDKSIESEEENDVADAQDTDTIFSKNADDEAVDALLAVRVRYKDLEASTATEFFSLANDDMQSFETASADFQFSAAVATFALALENAKESSPATLSLARELAMPAAAHDVTGYKSEFLSLIKTAEKLQKSAANISPSATSIDEDD